MRWNPYVRDNVDPSDREAHAHGDLQRDASSSSPLSSTDREGLIREARAYSSGHASVFVPYPVSLIRRLLDALESSALSVQQSGGEEALRAERDEARQLLADFIRDDAGWQHATGLSGDVTRLAAELEDARRELTIAHGKLWRAGLESHPGEDEEDTAASSPSPAPTDDLIARFDALEAEVTEDIRRESEADQHHPAPTDTERLENEMWGAMPRSAQKNAEEPPPDSDEAST